MQTNNPNQLKNRIIELEKELDLYKNKQTHFQQQILQRIDEPISIVDKTYRYIYINNAYCTLLNAKNNNEIIGHQIKEFIEDENFNDKVKPHFDLCLTTGKNVSYFNVLEFNTRKIHFLMNYYPYYDGNNQIIGVISTAKDITNEINLQNNFEKISINWQNTISSLDDIIFIINDDFIIEDINDKGIEFINKTREEIIGQRCYEVIHNKDKAQNFCSLCKVKKDGKPKISQFYQAQSDRWFSIKTSPVFDKTGKITHYVDMLRDITKLKKSEELYKTLVENLQEGIWLVDKKNHTTYVNPRMASMLGYTQTEMQDKHLEHFFEKELKKEYYTQTARRQAGIKEQHNFTFLKKNGEKLITRMQSAPFLSANGEYTGFISAVSDISDLKKYEQKLIDSKNKSETAKQKIEELLKQTQKQNKQVKILLEGAKTILKFDDFTKTSRQLFNYCKELTGAVSGYVALLSKDEEENEVLFLDDGGLECTVDPTLPMPIRGLRADSYYLKQPVYENNFMNSKWVKFMPDGHVILNNVLFAPLIVEDKTVGLIGLANKPTDFTNKDKSIVAAIAELTAIALNNSQTKKQLIKAKEEAQKSEQLKMAFLSNMSHEVRTPMNGIVGFCEMLDRKNITPEKRTKYIKIIKDSSQQLLTIINDILEISKIETGHVEEVSEIFLLNALLNEIYFDFKEPINDKQLDFYLHKPLNHTESKIYSDKKKIRNIFNHLINNAIKFTHSGSIHFGYEVLDNCYEFHVIDTGIGIRPELHEEIFKPFRQVEVTLTRKYGGTGLGLSICKSHVEILGGKMWLKSTPEQGSSFYFSIPKKKLIP